MKKTILLLVPLLLLLSSFSGGSGSKFEKRKYTHGHFAEGFKKLIPNFLVKKKTAGQDLSFVKHQTASSQSIVIASKTHSYRSYSIFDDLEGSDWLIFAAIVIALSFICAAIWVATATVAISFGAAFGYSLLSILGACCGCCCCGRHC